MKRKFFRRILSTVLSAVMILSVFAVSGISVGAAETTPKGQLSVVIKDVTRKYSVANSILSELNSKRSSNGKNTLLANGYLFDDAMERAAQLAIEPSISDLTGESFTDKGLGKEVVGVIDINLSSPMGASAIIQQLITDSIKFHPSNDYVSEALYDSNLLQVGVGAVYVAGNENTTKRTNKLFVCILMSNSSANQKTYDQSANNTDVVVNQATVMNASYFSNGVKKTVIRIGDSTTDMDYTRVTLQKDVSYQMLDKYTYNDITTTYAYLIPKVMGSGIKYTNVTPTTSTLNPSSISYCTGFTPMSATCAPILHYDRYDTLNSFERTFSFTAQGEFSPCEFDEDSVELEYESVYYDSSIGKYKPAVTVRDKNSGVVLEEGKDYTLKYVKYSEVPNSSTPEIEAYVKVWGDGDYINNVEVKKYYKICLAPDKLSVSMKSGYVTTDYNGTYYANDGIVVTAKPSKVNTTFTFTCKGPDGKNVEGSSSMSGYDGRFIFTPTFGGKYTVTANAVCGEETASKSLEINVTEDISAKLTLSDNNPVVGTTITLSAQISGGSGKKTVVFRDELNELPKKTETSVEYTPTDRGTQTLKCIVSDENGRKKTFTIDFVAAAEKTYPTVIARNLALKGEIGVNLYFTLPSNSYTIVMNGPAGEKKYPAANGYQTSGNMRGKYFFTYGVPVADMSADVTVTVLDENNQKAELYAYNGTENIRQTNDTYTVSVNSVMSATVTAYPELEDLAEATYSYGAYANKFFRKESVDESNIKNLDDINKVTSSTLDKKFGMDCQVQTNGSVPEGVTFRGFTLLLDEKTSIKVYVNCTDSDVKFKIGDDEVALQTNGKNTYLCQDNISVTRLGEPISFIATKGNSTYSIFCSPMSYAYSVLSNYEKTEKNQDLCQLMRAMYCYYDSAKSSLSE